MPGEEMIRWSQPPREVELTQDEIDLAKAIQDFLRDAEFLWENPFEYQQRMERVMREHGRESAYAGTHYFGIPRQEVNLSPEAMGLLRDSLDATLEYYGTSGDLDPRGYWMPIDGEASR